MVKYSIMINIKTEQVKKVIKKPTGTTAIVVLSIEPVCQGIRFTKAKAIHLKRVAEFCMT